MNLRYIIPRIIRHFLPEALTRFLLHRGWIIRPGMESSDPQLAVERYQQVLEDYGHSLTGKRVLVFGYGGRFDIGLELLRHGVAHVILCDRYALPDETHNRTLVETASGYLHNNEGKTRPCPEWITLFQGDIRAAIHEQRFAPVDIVLSTSVFEHIPGAEMDGICTALAALTAPGGRQLHFIDLRDHFFKYPFEMLTFTKQAWQRWLNPTSNLNRWRTPDYHAMFAVHFSKVEITILESDLVAFERVRQRVQPEFLVDDPQLQAATLIRLDAVP